MWRTDPGSAPCGHGARMLTRFKTLLINEGVFTPGDLTPIVVHRGDDEGPKRSKFERDAVSS